MKTLAFLSHKGGTGKSSLSIHLAVAAQSTGLEVLLVDLDHYSGTVAEWASVRTGNQPLAVTAQFSDIKALHQQANDEDFDLLILDCPPYLNAETQQISDLADMTLLPVSPRFTEISTLPRDLGLVQKPFFVVLNSCTTGIAGEASFKTEQVRKVLEENRIPVSPVHITRLEAFTDALSYGQGVTEYQQTGQAAKQVSALLGWLTQNISEAHRL